MSLVPFARTALVALTALALLPASALAGTQYQYDTLGRLTRVAYDNGWVVLYSYDAAGNRSQVVAGVDVAAPNRPPVAVNDSYELEVHTTGYFYVRDNDSDPDGDPLTITSVTGSGATIASGGGHIVYAGGGLGTKTLTYTISDGRGGTASASVTVQMFRIFPGDPSMERVFEGPDVLPEATPAEAPQTPEAVDEQ